MINAPGVSSQYYRNKGDKFEMGPKWQNVDNYGDLSHGQKAINWAVLSTFVHVVVVLRIAGEVQGPPAGQPAEGRNESDCECSEDLGENELEEES